MGLQGHSWRGRVGLVPSNMHFFVAVVLAGTAGTVDLKQYIQSSDSVIRARAAYVFARSTDMDSSSNVLGVRKRMRTAPPPSPGDPQ